MQEQDRARLRELLRELTNDLQDLDGMPASKLALVTRLRDLGRGALADRFEAGAGFSLVAGDGGWVEIISGGRREALFAEAVHDLIRRFGEGRG